MYIDSKMIIKEFRSYVDGFVESCESDNYTHELLKAVDKLIEEQEERIAIMSEGGWIPVEKRKPKSMANKVLVFLQHEDLVGYIGFGHYEKFHGEELWYDLEHNAQFAQRGYTVTHWMELPEQPKEGDPG